MFDPWTWRDPAALAGGYSGVPDEDLGVDTAAPTPPPDGRADVDLTGYHVEATDGRIGTVDEANHDTGTAHLVVDTGPWIFGRKVLLPAGTVDHVDHRERTVHVDRTRQQVKDSPAYDPDTFTQSGYRDQVGRYYTDSYARAEPGTGPDR